MPGWATPPRSDDRPYRDANRGVRLQKVLAEAGIGSRRTCETLIESGAVEVNGTPIDDLPAWVDPARDRVTVNGNGIGRTETHEYILVFKPRGVVCTNEDPMGRKRAIDLVGSHASGRLYSVGRLDVDSSGLLLLTNDGELANRLTHPRYGVHKVYEVSVEGVLRDEQLQRLERGLFLPERRKQGRRTAESRLRVVRRDRDRTLLHIELREGRNRQVRRMLLDVGHKVRRLRRIGLGPLKLKGLKTGEWRHLTEKELGGLRKAAGLGRT